MLQNGVQRRARLSLAAVALVANGSCAPEAGPPALPGHGGQNSGGQASAPAQSGSSSPSANGGGAMAGTGGGGGSASPHSGSGGSAGLGAAAGAGPSLGGSPVVFVGGYGDAPVRQYDLNRSTGALTERGPAIDAGPEATCFAVHPAQKYLFVGNEGDGAQGGITSYALQADGSVTFINHQSTGESGFTALAVHPSGKLIAGASYGGGSSSVFPILADGSVGTRLGVAEFGSGAQAHGVAYSPDGQHLLVTTKGSDSVQQLLHSDTGGLLANAPPSVASADGPRHLAVHPNGKLVFVVAEGGSMLTTFQLSSEGKLNQLGEISTLPADFSGSNTGAHVELGVTGQVLYVSNRGHDSVGVFSVNEQSGALTLLELEPARGNNPHDFDIDENGKLLIAANRLSGTLSVFAIAGDGLLSPLGQPVPTREDPTAVLIHYPR